MLRGMEPYERRIGRYGDDLADALLAIAGARAGQRAIDVGCGSGALTAPLADIVGAGNVAAVDPDGEAVALCARRVPGADVRVAHAESLPYADDEFDLALAQLVMALVDDAERAARELLRVARPGAAIATCAWDFEEGMTMLRCFWDAAAVVAPERARDYDQARAHTYSTRAALDELWRSAGMVGVTTGEIDARAEYRDFADLWEPLTVPDGSPGYFLEGLEEDDRARVRDGLCDRLGSPVGAFGLTARAWYVLGYAAG